MGQLCPHCRSRFDDDTLERCPHDRKRLVPDLSGQTIGDRYTLRELLGVGGMDSSVWMAWQTSTQRTVAIKVLPPVEGDAAERFARGGRIASNLNHPNITTVHDYGRTENGGLYLVMELLEGVTLYRALRKTPFPLERTVHVIDQVLRALGHAHRRGVVHRDIKLSNLFLTPRDDDPDFVKVLDFGIARFIEEPPESWGEHANNEITTTRQLCGTPQYMAPEQIGFGRIDARADLYAVGVATYRMITGRFPFQGTPHEQFRAHLQATPPPFTEVRPDLAVPPEIEAWIMRALEKDPDQRFASAEEMRTALRSIRKRHDIGASELEDSSVRSAPHSRSSPSSVSWAGEAHSRPTEHIVPDEPQRRRTWVWVSLVALLLFVIAALLLTRRETGDGPTITALAPREPVATAGADTAPPPPLDPAVAAPDAARPAPAAAPAPDAAAAPAAPARRAVRITSRPDGATITRDGEVIGDTPLVLQLPPGAYLFQLSRPGHQSASIRVEVGADGDETVVGHAVLDPEPRRAAAAAEPRRPAPPPAPKAATPVKPTPEPPAVAQPAVPKKPDNGKSTVRMQLLDEDEARSFDIGGRGKTPPPAPTGDKPAVELLE
ncbi:MAG: serine/threonine-protein kinase [bacterium]